MNTTGVLPPGGLGRQQHGTLIVACVGSAQSSRVQPCVAARNMLYKEAARIITLVEDKKGTVKTLILSSTYKV